MQILNYTPGALATIFLEINDGYESTRIDAFSDPIVTNILLPNLTNDGYDGYQIAMTHIDAGLYVFQYQIPSGASAVGSYLIDISYIHPTTFVIKKQAFQLVVSAPFGIYSMTVPTT